MLFAYVDSGFVSLDDWTEIDPKQLLEGFRKGAEEDNEYRRCHNGEEIHVIDWIQEPTLDRSISTVYWAIEVEGGTGERVVNSMALRLGRKGFELLNWVTDNASYKHFGGDLDVMLRAHSFDAGFHYSDRISSDKVASYGIAGLVAATVGAKFGKAAVIGGLGLLKAFKGVIAACFAGLFYFLKGLFKRGSDGQD